jgi:hypothetical protein
MAVEKEQEVAMTEKEMQNVTNTTARVLGKQDKVSIKLYQVPESSTEPKLPDEEVTVNGYKYVIPRGINVDVPQTVKEILEQAGRL